MNPARGLDPRVPGEVLQYALDRAWQRATFGFYDASDAVIDAFGYARAQPLKALDAIGDFAHDQAIAKWDELRDVYGAADQLQNTILDFIHTPCREPWLVLARAALPPANEAMRMLFTPSVEEVLEEYLGPKLTGGPRKPDPEGRDRRRRRSPSGRTRRSWPGIPDADSRLAALLPGASLIDGRQLGRGEWWLWKIFGLTELVGWYTLLADISAQGLINWSSGIMEARFCERPWDHIYVGEWGTCLSGGPNFEERCAEWSIDTAEGIASTGSTGATFVNSAGAVVTASGEARVERTTRRLTGGAPTLTYRATLREDRGPGLVFDIDTHEIEIPQNASVTFALSGKFTNARNVAWVINLVEGSAGGSHWEHGTGFAGVFGETD